MSAMARGRPRLLGATLVAGAAGAVFLLALLALGEATAIRASWPGEADTLYLPGSDVLRVASLGHHEMAADLVAARTYVYYGTQLSGRGEHKWLERYLSTINDLDPRFHSTYMRGAAILVYTGRRITVESLLAANRVLERGIREFPYDWELLFQMGFNFLFELPQTDRDDPRVAEWRQRGVDALRQASQFEQAPAWLPNLVARMMTKQGSDELAIKHLEQTYAVASNDETREQIRLKLMMLRGKQFTEQIEREQRAFAEMLSQRYPYAPEAFSIIAGPRRDPGFDPADLLLAPPPAAPPSTPSSQLDLTPR